MPEIKTKVFENENAIDNGIDLRNWFLNNRNVILVSVFVEYATLGREKSTITVRYYE